MEIAVETGEDLSTVEECIRVINRFHWNLEVYDDGALHVLAGDGRLGTFESEQEMATFLKGAALALSVLPEEVRQVYDKWIGLDVPPQ